ncbi:MAG: transglycosylase domain-containing protein [Longimicrobiales bacterium]
MTDDITGSTADPESVPPEERRSWRGLRVLLGLLLVAVVLAVLGVREVRSSRLQAALFTRLADGIGFSVEAGPSPSIRFPDRGPYDRRLGYTRIPDFTLRMDSLGFDLTHQARFSPRLLRVTDWGAYPVYETKASAGLTVQDRRGRPIVQERYPSEAYAHFDSIPEMMWRSLLYIESREFLAEEPQQNPAVEWDRFLRSVAELAFRNVGISDGNVAGGSTLATQIQKYRHSPAGLTRSPADKLRQMFSASLRAYRDGPDTRRERREIVRDYLNSVPLAAQAGHGEVIGTADGLRAWYGLSLDSVNAVLASGPVDPEGRRLKAEVYRRVLSLLLAHRRPSFYLTRPDGRVELADLTDTYLGLLARDRVIPRWMADEARRARDSVQLAARAPEEPPRSFAERKAETMVRTELLRLTGVGSLYDLDRLDMDATSTVDFAWHREATTLLRSLRSPDFIAREGFGADRLLDVGDPAGVLYSVTLLEATPEGNVVRLQTDNYEGPLSLGTASRLELGSTAKLRTLVTYLEIVDELWDELDGLSADSLRARSVAPRNRLERWVVDWFLVNPGGGKRAILDAAMQRTYSANPGERFVTGGGTQTFANFDNQYDGRVMTVAEAFRHSVNLPFVRIMRDLVQYEMARFGMADVLEDPDDPARRFYLERFADQEGSIFVRQFHGKYRGLTGPEIFDRLVEERRLGSRRMAWAFRTVAPDADLERFSVFLRENLGADERLSDAVLADLYRRTDPAAQTLSDLGFLARIHPLELWVASYLLHNPGASVSEVLTESRDARLEVYRWLFRTSRVDAQNERIRSMLEMEAFQGVLRRWRRVGYPFTNIVPSLGTAIGSSGDRPSALAELAGIIARGGVRAPVRTLTSVDIARDTPYETRWAPATGTTERVLGVETAAVLRDAMVDVVENGTARRARGALRDEDGTPLQLGGKTGTGDNRFRVFAPGGVQTASRVVNRTATFVFFAGDRYFGVVVAYVPGPEAEQYRFTSGLPSQLLRTLGGRLAAVNSAEAAQRAEGPSADPSPPDPSPPDPGAGGRFE